MKNKYKIILTSITTALFLSACGGGGSAEYGQTQRPIVDCNTTTVISEYTIMYSDETILNDESNTTIQTYHSGAGDKYVCVVNGKAHLE